MRVAAFPAPTYTCHLQLTTLLSVCVDSCPPTNLAQAPIRPPTTDQLPTQDQAQAQAQAQTHGHQQRAGTSNGAGEKQVFTSGRIAVVRPFIPSHVDRLVEDMASWERPEFRPCDPGPVGKDDGDRPDLVLYFSYPLDQFPEVVSTLERAWAAATWRPCFAEMRVISAGLDPAADRYLPSQKTAESAKDEAEAEEAKRPAPSGASSGRTTHTTQHTTNGGWVDTRGGADVLQPDVGPGVRGGLRVLPLHGARSDGRAGRMARPADP